MKRIDNVTEQRIIYLYTTPTPDGSWMGGNTIALLLGISTATVRNALERNNVPVRDYKESHSNGKRCKPIKNLPPAGEIPPLCKCGCGNPVSWNQRKNQWNAYFDNHYRKDAPYKDPDWLNNEYSVLQRSIDDIAQQCQVNRSTVKRFMRKFNIPVRAPGETLILSGKSRGANNPAWKGGIALWSYAPDWKRIAHGIRKRDKYTCQICKVQFPKSSKLLHVHHKDGDKFNNDPSNLVTVCATCHPKGKRKENGHI